MQNATTSEVNSFKVLNEGKSWGAAEGQFKIWPSTDYLDPWDYIRHDLSDHSFAREAEMKSAILAQKLAERTGTQSKINPD